MDITTTYTACTTDRTKRQTGSYHDHSAFKPVTNAFAFNNIRERPITMYTCLEDYILLPGVRKKIRMEQEQA